MAMIYVYGFVAGAVALFVAGLVAMRGAGRTRERAGERADMVRLTGWISTGPVSHRRDEHATDTGHIPRHHELDVATLRRVLLEPTAEFHAIIATTYGTAERSILTGHSGRSLAVTAA